LRLAQDAKRDLTCLASASVLKNALEDGLKMTFLDGASSVRANVKNAKKTETLVLFAKETLICLKENV